MPRQTVVNSARLRILLDVALKYSDRVLSLAGEQERVTKAVERALFDLYSATGDFLSSAYRCSAACVLLLLRLAPAWGMHPAQRVCNSSHFFRDVPQQNVTDGDPVVRVRP